MKGVDGRVNVKPKLFKRLLRVTRAGKYRGPHQRPVLTLPAWKLLSDKKLGSSKGKRLRVGDSSLDEGRGHSLWKRRGTGDRQTGIRAEQGLGLSLLNF